MSCLSGHRSLLVLLGLGLALRLVLALVLFPGQGLSSDLGFFESWATTLARVGPERPRAERVRSAPGG